MGIDFKKEKCVFISYSTKDQQKADSVRQFLEENEISCLMVENDIPTGSKNADANNDILLENSDCLLLLCANATQLSQFAQQVMWKAITYSKPIVPMQLESSDGNDESEFRNILDSIKGHLDSEKSETVKKTESPAVTEEKKSCQVTIFSPVNVDVYHEKEDEEHLVMHVDRNTGYHYSRNNIVVGKEFTLIFSGKNFKKTRIFDRPDNDEFEYRLPLTVEEIEDAYDREEAFDRIKKDLELSGNTKDNATGYAFDQLAAVGKEEDIEYLHAWLSMKSQGVAEADSSRNYLIAKCAVALGELSIKYGSFECAADIPKVYDKYKAKKSYGFYFENILQELSTAMKKELI